MKRLPVFYLILIVIVAFLFRVYRFGSIPMGITPDEAALGYNSFLLMHTGQEEHGVSWPIKFESFGDWKQPVYIYLSMPIIKLFGLSTVTVRLLSLVSGLVMITAAWFVANKISGKPGYDTIAAFITAVLLVVNPWHFYASHVAMEAFVASALFISGIYFLMRQSASSTVIGLLLLLLGIETYHAALVVIPLWFGFYAFAYVRQILSNKVVFAAALVFVGIIVGLLLKSWFSSERAKVSGTAIFAMTNEKKWEEIYRYRTNSLSSKIQHNIYTYSMSLIVHNYITELKTLVIEPENNDTFPGYANILVVEALLAFVGAIYVIKTKNRWGLLILTAFLLSILPGAITRGVRTNRLLFMLPQVQILAGIGASALIYFSQSKLYKYMLTGVLGIFMLIQIIPFYSYYYTAHNLVENPYFADYMKDISLYVRDYQNEYETIYFTYPRESPYIFYAFFTSLNPQSFFASIEYYPEDELGFRYAKRLGNMEFVMQTRDLEDLPKEHLEKSLVIARVQEAKGIPPKKLWYDAGGRPQVVAFDAKYVRR